MDTKLTLKLDKSVIERAKVYAASQNRSLSKMIESYLRSLTESSTKNQKEDIEISDFVKKMATGVKVPLDIDLKNKYGSFLAEKYK